ncbi:Response regulator rcp1 [Rubripirellula obstinata]|uniref:Response regulator rcp1 n=1 Tax=Rubripirellula obstinata TaxID=406547 RepID=A0A5B1CR34_9BACT|nr:response regulator [Rubripirellula obstinata]KAA1261704.1 Response regulator rcp1 [Rubripirellula obstinata]
MTLKTVLLVEDSPDDQFMGKEMFRRAIKDVEVVCVFDGSEALERLAEEDFRPDVILLDINMPRMNGLQFLQNYGRKNDPTIPPVVVMLTSSEQASDKAESMAYACVKHYFVKPLQKSNIEAIVEMLDAIDG